MTGPASGAASRFLAVLDAGPLTTVQDLGRPGWAHLGVPRSGALDRPAAALANRLVGNPDHAAVLETTQGGVTLRGSTAMTMAVTGADAPVAARSGLRSYLAAAGGIDVPVVLGSRSTDTLSGLGPAAITAGDELPVGAPLGEPQGIDVSVVRGLLRPVTLRYSPGPRVDWFTEGRSRRWAGRRTPSPPTPTGSACGWTDRG